MQFPTRHAAPLPAPQALPRPSDYCDSVLPYLLSAVARLRVICLSRLEMLHIVCHYNFRVIKKITDRYKNKLRSN